MYSGRGMTGFVHDGLLALVGCELDGGVVSTLWPIVCQGGGLPAFAAAITDGHLLVRDVVVVQIRGFDVSLLVRGSASVVVYRLGQTPYAITVGPDGSWREESVADADRVELRGTGTAPMPFAPLTGGVVDAGLLSQVLTIAGYETYSYAPPAPVQMPAAAAPALDQVSTPEPIQAPMPTPVPALGPDLVPARLRELTAASGAGSAAACTPQTPAQPPQQVMPLLGQLFGQDAPPAQAEGAAPAPVMDALGPLPFEVAQRTSVSGGSAVQPLLADSPAAETANGELFYAVRCPQLHLNPTATAACRECHLPLDPTQAAVKVPQPPVGQLRRLDTGEVWPLSRPSTVIGRAPAQPAHTVPGGVAPPLPVVVTAATVADLHAEVRLHGWRIEVFDYSHHGTIVINPGADPVRAQRGSGVRLLPGGRIVLAGDVTFVFEVPR